MKALLIKGAKFRADTGIVLIRYVAGGILPYVKSTSLRLDAKLATSAVFDRLRQMRSSAKSQRKVVRWNQFVLMEGVYTNWSCTFRESLFYRKRKNGFESHREILQGHVAPHEKSGKERVHREALFKSVNLISAIRALPDLRKELKTKPCAKKDAPAE